jgi:hypothetical protein
MPMRFSIVFDLPKSRWGRSHLPNKVPDRWPNILVSLYNAWVMGDSTELVTAFVEYLDNPDPLGRRLPDI